MTLGHFYHVFCGEWRDPVAEHMAALEASGFDGQFHVGIVGSASDRAEVVAELDAIRPASSVTTATEGFEQVTLAPLRAWAIAHPDDTVLYAHTKGASDPSPINVEWRRSMSMRVVRACVHLSETVVREGVDAAGCHWLTPEMYPGVVNSAMFGGTYWLATCAYVAGLPVCAEDSRWDAEAWIGLNDPQVIDLLPGWPGTFGRVKYARLVAHPAL